MIMWLKKFHFLYMITVFLFLFLAFSPRVYAESYKKLTYKNLTIDNELQESTIDSIIQNNDRYIWIITKSDLNTSKSLIKKNTRYPNYLSNEYITIIRRGSYYNAWIGTRLGKSNEYNKKQNKFKVYRSLRNTKYVASNYIITMYEDNPKNLLCTCNKKNQNGIWSEKKVRMVISTSLWKTLTYYGIYILIFIVMVYIIWRHIGDLECKVQERTMELNNKLIENDVLYKKNLEIEKFKNTYFVNLSHELRTPLNVILSAVQFLDKCAEEDIIMEKKKFQEYMNVIKKNSNNLLEIINDIIDSSKMESGTYEINFIETDIIYLVEETALSMKSYVESKNIELIIDPEVEEKIIKCDPVEIERCIINLINNAIKFTPSGGSIWVRIYDKHDKVEIAVKDTGIGISKKDQNAIFERFFQSHSMEDKKLGSGIGLALVKYVIELHNGTIKVKSEALNKGSEFIITLPTEHEEKC